jgi:hypothetical protein
VEREQMAKLLATGKTDLLDKFVSDAHAPRLQGLPGLGRRSGQGELRVRAARQQVPAAQDASASRRARPAAAQAKVAAAQEGAPAKKAPCREEGGAAPRKTGAGLKPSDRTGRGDRRRAGGAHRGDQEAVGLHQGQRPAGRDQQARDQRRRQAAAGVRQAAGDDVRAGRASCLSHPDKHLAELVFLATPESGIRTLADLTARAKAEPGKLSYASAGIGGTQHLSGEMYKSAAHVFITHIPYRGSGPAQSDFLGNQVPLMVDSVTAALPHIKAGKAVALAVTSATRSSQLPDVPTVRESGVAGTKNFEAVGWLGLMAPRGTPPDIVERLNREVTDILKTEQMVRFIRERGAESAPTSGPEFDRFVASEIGLWGAAVKASGAKPE